MKLQLTNEEKLDFFYNALCNIGGILRGYGIELNYKDSEYEASKNKLENPCFEDVLRQMLLDGYQLIFEDVENDGDETRSVTLQTVYDNIETTPYDHLNAMATGQDDADTADAIIQSVLYREIVFG